MLGRFLFGFRSFLFRRVRLRNGWLDAGRIHLGVIRSEGRSEPRAQAEADDGEGESGG